ncbi:MAG: tyrosine-type recombinase/integrase [Candidatus Melainabacteria bacterium]|nr:tyrosine-type recombinase/integrase [Candidatus Melainabacteria bacterium]
MTLNEVAGDLRLSRRSILRLAKAKDLPTITKPFPGGFTYLIPLNSYLEWKKTRQLKKKEENSLSNKTFVKEQISEWLDWLKTGKLIGKPLSEHTIRLYIYCFGIYWNNLVIKRGNRNSLISVANLRQVLGSIDPKSFSIKDNLYKAIRSFIKYLIINGLVDKKFLEELKELKPKRFYPAKKVHCSQDEFERLLIEASRWHSGQTPYDVILNSTTIATIGLAGLRASELCNLKVQDVDLVNRKLFVYLGKGKKNRFVGISNRLYDYLANYLKLRPKTNLENFFVTTIRSTRGELVPFNTATLLRKVKRLSKRIGIEVNVHGLRRTFATIAANSGKPINIISLALGHADLKTTQGYLMTTQDEVIKEMQGW